jgi:hypothetical protein
MTNSDCEEYNQIQLLSYKPVLAGNNRVSNAPTDDVAGGTLSPVSGQKRNYQMAKGYVMEVSTGLV